MVTMAIVSFTNYKRKQTRGMMRAVMRYTMQEKKTAWEDKRLVTGVNCSTETVCGDFMTTKRLHHKEGGTLFYHMVQSFPAGEAVDPVTAHTAALELANYFPDCEVLVCTHIDRDHTHSHFIINSVQLENGKKLHISSDELNELRQRNDEVCMKFGLPVFQMQKKKPVKSVSNAEYHTAIKGESWKLRLANTIDECMKYAATKEEFISLMESEGYAVRWERGRKYITYTTPEGMRCRDSKLHEEKYLKENMEYEFRIRAAEITARVEADEPAEHRAVDFADCTHHTHRDPVSDGRRSAGADTAGERCLLGAASAAGVSSESEIPHRPDGGTDLADGNAKLSNEIDFSAGTGWDVERAAYLQMAELASGFRPAGGHQVDRAGAGFDHGGAGDGVRRGNGGRQHPKPVSLTPLYGLAALGALMEDDSEDTEERYRRIQAEQEAKNFGAVIGLAAGAAIALTKKPEEEVQQEEQQTMGGL